MGHVFVEGLDEKYIGGRGTDVLGVLVGPVLTE